MGINELLIEAFAGLDLEASQDEYTGKKDKYVVFNYTDEKVSLNGDNVGEADTYYLQIMLITPKNYNYFGLKNKIKNTLESLGFSVSSERSFLGDVYSETDKIRTTAFDANITIARVRD